MLIIILSIITFVLLCWIIFICYNSKNNSINYSQKIIDLFDREKLKDESIDRKFWNWLEENAKNQYHP